MDASSAATDRTIQRLVDELGTDAVLTESRDLQLYGYDATLHMATPEAVVLPTATEQVVTTVAVCSEEGIPLTPRGSATSLSGGPVPVHGGVVISLTRMNRILDIDEANMRAVVEAGVINADLNDALAARDMMYAPDPASQIACTMGGNVAENAGGPHCLKYGVTVNHVTGLTVVTADAQVVQLGSKAALSPGLDLRGVVIGSEGTLAIVTEIICRLLPQPPALVTMLACFGSIEDAAGAVSDIIATGLLPATIEMVDRLVISAIEQQESLGYPEDVEAVLVVEIDGMAEALRPQVAKVQEICRTRNVMRFEWADDEAERERLWKGRKGATAALALLAPAKLSTDVTVPRTRLPEALAEIAEISRRFGIPIGNVFHAGDGNLHPQVIFDPRDRYQMARAMGADEAITEMALRYGGVLTGEHGVGSEKRKWMTKAYGPAELRAMWAVKRAFDPRELLNPGKVLPDEADIQSVEQLSFAGRLPNVQAGQLSAVSADEVASVIGAAFEAGLPVNVSDQSCLRRDDCLDIDLRQLDRIIDYDAGNLTISVGAGMRLGALLEVLAERGQTIGPWQDLPRELTVGHLAATAMPTPALTRYGSVRDVVLGLQVVAGNKLVKLGSSCVKNVAGYALERLFVGSFCIFGPIVAVTLRTHPLPQATATVIAHCGEGAVVARLSRELAHATLPLTWAMVSPAAKGPPGLAASARWTVAVKLGGWREEVEAAVEAVKRCAREQGAEPAEVLDGAEPELDMKWLAGGGTQPCLLAMPQEDAMAFALERPDVVEAVWPLAGIVLVQCDTARELESTRDALLPMSAAEVVSAAAHPAIARVTRELKNFFDPHGLLPPWNTNADEDSPAADGGT